MKKLLIGLILIFLPLLANAAGEPESLERRLRPLMNDAENIEVKLPEENVAARHAAEALFQLYQSEEFQARIQQERQRLSEEFFGVKRVVAEGGNEKNSKHGKLTGEDKIYLFISSSVPLATLRNYAADIVKLNDPRFILVLRGFVGGAKRIGPTASFIVEVLKEDPNCTLSSKEECAMREVPFIVDPTLFRKVGIEKVPAIAFLSGDKQTPFIVYGDASLGYVLERFARETRHAGLEQLADKLKPIP